jgi:hypothetical protein
MSSPELEPSIYMEMKNPTSVKVTPYQITDTTAHNTNTLQDSLYTHHNRNPYSVQQSSLYDKLGSVNPHNRVT